jgi:hypothetical protein
MVSKSHKWSSAEGDNDENKDAGTNGAPGDGKRLMATDSRDTSSTKGNGTTTPHDCDAETNLQKDADTDARYNCNAETNKQKDAGTESQLISETLVWNTTVSKNVFSNLEKHKNLTLSKYSTILHRELGIHIFAEDTINHPK